MKKRSPNARLRKKVKVICPEDGCRMIAKGFDIEAVWDEDNEPVWAVSYECSIGHTFIAEYERDCELNGD